MLIREVVFAGRAAVRLRARRAELLPACPSWRGPADALTCAWRPAAPTPAGGAEGAGGGGGGALPPPLLRPRSLLLRSLAH